MDLHDPVHKKRLEEENKINLLIEYLEKNCIQCDMTKLWLNRDKVPFITKEFIKQEDLEKIKAFGLKLFEMKEALK